jgi:tetratricopeptide (TPR) repeat protein
MVSLPMPFLRHALFLVLAATAFADARVDAAMALLHAKRLLEARNAFEQIVQTEPQNAAAWHELGLLWRSQGDNEGFEKAVSCLARATEIEPANETFLANYGGTLMELANRTRSISAATKGRDAMERAVAMNPNDLDAREGLFQYYLRAPFFVGGSEAKAAEQLDEIRRRDPDRATVLAVISKTKAKDYAAAFALCEEVLAKHPDNYPALYQYGRTASMSGENLPRALTLLQHALQFDPPTPASPQHTHVWFRIGDIQQKLGHLPAAKQAFQEALKLDPGNRAAADALAKLPAAP